MDLLADRTSVSRYDRTHKSHKDEILHYPVHLQRFERLIVRSSSDKARPGLSEVLCEISVSRN